MKTRILVVLLLATALPCGLKAQALWNGFNPQQTASNPLQLRVSDGDLTSTLGTFRSLATNFVLTPNATNYIFLDLTMSPPKLTVNTSGFPTASVYQIAIAVTNATKITSLTDSRPAFNSLLYPGGGGGSSAFPAITSGTNTIAAMVVGTGASLGTSGSGTIAATTAATASAVPWTGITSLPANCAALQFVTGLGATLSCGNVYYQTIQSNGSSVAQEPIWNAVPPFKCVDNAGNTRSDCSIPPFVTAGGSHASGLVPDPGAVLHNYPLCDNGTFSTACQASAGLLPNPVISASLVSSAPWELNLDMQFCGANPFIDIRCYGGRAIFASSNQLANGGVTANITNGTNSAVISTGAYPFVNGDYALILGAGATQSMSTPSAPTATASVAAGPTGTGNTVAAPAGSTTYCAKIAAFDTGRGYTVASSAGCTTTGPASLGAQTLAYQSTSLSNNTLTVNATGASSVLAVGQWLEIGGLNQFVNVATLSTNSFTALVGQDTRNGASSVATGAGTLYYMNAIHYALPTPGAGVYQFAIWVSRNGGSYVQAAMSMPVNASSATDAIYYSWDDYGTTMSASPTIPLWVPSTPPAAASNDALSAQVTAGGGTTTLTLSVSAGSGAGACSSACPILLDNGPALKAAASAANSGVGGMVYIPATLNGLSFPIQSYTDLSAYSITVSQASSILLNDTVNIGGMKWVGDQSYGQLSTSNFGFTKGVNVNVSHAFPGFLSSSSTINLSGVQFTNPSNSSMDILVTGGSLPTGIIQNFGIGGNSTDYMSTLVRIFGGPGVGSSGIQLRDFTIAPGSPQTTGSTFTPLLDIEGFGEVTLSNFFLNRRGIFFKEGTTSGIVLEAAGNFERQGGIMPMFNFMPMVANGGFTAKIHNMVQDTETVPLVANLEGPAAATNNPILLLDSPGAVSGILFGYIGAPSSNSGIGINQNTRSNTVLTGNAIDGMFSSSVNGVTTSKMQLNELLTIGQGYAGFADSPNATAPVASAASSGGSMASNSYTVQTAPVFYEGGTYAEGARSPASNSITTSGTCPGSGNCQIPVTWTTVPGAVGYDLYLNGLNLSCTLGNYTGTSVTLTASTTCGGGAISGGGPTGFNSSGLWGNNLSLATPGAAPTGVAGTTQVYMDPTASWLNAKINGNTAYTIPGISGSITNGHSLCASGTIGIYTDCAGSAGNVTNALLNSFAIYTAAGSSNQIGGVPGPVSPANVPQYVIYNPNGTTSGAPTPALAGVPGRTNASASDAIVAGDRNNWVVETFAGAQAVSISSAIYTSNFAFKMAIQGSNAVMTLTPSSGTCNGTSTCTGLQGQILMCASIDTVNLTCDIHEQSVIAGTNTNSSRSNSGITINAPNAGNMSNNIVNTMTSAGTIDLSAASVTGGFTLPKAAGANPTTSGAMAFNTSTQTLVYGGSSATLVSAVAAVGAGNTATTCTNQAITAISGVTSPTCSTVANAMLANPATTANGQTCTLGSTCNVNVGATAHGVALNEGNGSAIGGTAVLSTNQLLAGVSSADPVAKSPTDLTGTFGAADTGSVNVLTACSTPAGSSTPLTYQEVVVNPNHNNTTTNPTLNWCSQGAQTITRFGTGALTSGDLVAGALAVLKSDGTHWQLQNPQTVTGGSSVAWSSILNAAGALTLANSGNATTFNQTSAVNWTWANTTAATSGASQSSPLATLCGQGWETVTPANTQDCSTIQQSIPNGANSQTLLTFANNTSSTNANGPGFTFNGQLYSTGSAAAYNINSQGSVNAYLSAGGIGCGSGTRCIAMYNSGNTNSGSIDADISRVGAGLVGVGSGAAGSMAGLLKTGNASQVVTSNFTTAANTSLQTITGLTWTVPAVAANYSFSCDLAYSQATATTSIAFGMQVATNNPTNAMGTGTMQISSGGGASTYVSGTLTGLASTTASNIVSATPGATGTVYTVHLGGTIENGANANTFNIMVATGGSGDVVTVYRGSACQLY